MTTKAHGPLLEDIRRTIKAAKEKGWRQVVVRYPNGTEIVISEGDEAEAASAPNPINGGKEPHNWKDW